MIFFKYETLIVVFSKENRRTVSRRIWFSFIITGTVRSANWTDTQTIRPPSRMVLLRSCILAAIVVVRCVLRTVSV